VRADQKQEGIGICNPTEDLRQPESGFERKLVEEDVRFGIEFE